MIFLKYLPTTKNERTVEFTKSFHIKIVMDGLEVRPSITKLEKVVI